MDTFSKEKGMINYLKNLRRDVLSKILDIASNIVFGQNPLLDRFDLVHILEIDIIAIDKPMYYNPTQYQVSYLSQKRNKAWLRGMQHHFVHFDPLGP
jgi:hypothetical protein